MQLRLLGTFEARLDGLPLERFRSAKVRALLAYLAVEIGRPHLRGTLATLLWGEYPEADAQQSLSQALTNLRNLLGAGHVGPAAGPLLMITRQAVELHPGPDSLWVDVHVFDSLLASADPRHASALGEGSAAGLLAEAVALYQGPFLAGLAVADSVEFEEWLTLHREQRHQAALLALERLVGHHLAEGRMELVEQYARRQLALEPWSESGHQAVMFALALEGRRAAALQQYVACRRVLADELDIEPSAETEALAEQIRDGVLIDGRVGSSPPPAPFVARERELSRLDQSLARALAGQGRVALVTGEAGTGKTALLNHFARRVQGQHLRLVVAGGRCGAYAGLGDPLLPFREILQALTGEMHDGWAGGGNPEHARRLVTLFPRAVEALLAEGPDLIGRLVSAKSLTSRAETLAPPGAPWRDRLVQHLGRSPHSSSPDGSLHMEAAPQQEALFGQVAGVLKAIARKQPLLLLIDDLQWADAASLSLLFYLGRNLAGCRILVAGAYRPSEIASPLFPPLQQRGGVEAPGSQGRDDRHPLEAVVHEFGRLWGDIRVDLDAADGRRFVDALLDGEPNRLGERFRDRLTRHTGGHALFTIELLRAFQEKGDLAQNEEGCWIESPDLRWEGLPPQVEAVIAERVGRLPREGRRLLEAASVEGESFSAEVAARALGVQPAWALRWLSGPLSGQSRLVQALGIQSLQADGRPLSRYRFAHGLFQAYLYGRLDAVDRAHLHGEVGAALEALCHGDETALAQASPQLSRHYEEAGRVLEAARYRLEAGRWAAKLVAYEEAISHLERGLVLLEGVAASPERLRLELRLWMAIGMSATLQGGWQAPAHALALERLSNLIQHPSLQEDPHRLTALSVLALSAAWSADPERCGSVGQQLLGLAPSASSGQAPSASSGQAPSASSEQALSEGPSTWLGIRSEQAQEGDRQPIMLGHWALGFSHWLRGQPVPAREHLSRALALYDPEANRPMAGLVAADPGVMAQAILGAVLWQLGYPEQGRASLGQAVLQAQALQQPSSVAFARYMAAVTTSALGRDVAAALRHAEALRPLGKFSLVYRAWAEMLAGLAQAGQAVVGTDEEGLEHSLARVLEAGSTWRAAGSGGGYAGLLLVQADVCARAGQPEMGLEAMDKAQAWIERTGMRATEAEVWRMRGDLLLAKRPDRSARPVRSPDASEAETCFHRALAVAREQGSRWLELRAALSLARLWQGQGRSDEARELLAGIYSWFTEGFDTVDLVEAKALLEALA